MAGCELNVAHAFVSAPTAHRLRHDVIVTSADDYDASRRRHCVQDDETERDRGSMMSHYRLVPSALGPDGSGEWVTLSKSVLLQLVERICQLSFQTENLATTVACPPSACPSSDRFETSSTAISTDAAKLTNTPSSNSEAELPSSGSPSNDVAATSSTPPADVVDISNSDSAGELTPNSQQDISDVRTSDDTNVIVSQEVDVDETAEDANCDNDDDGDDSEVFAGPEVMQEGGVTDNLADTPFPMSTSPHIAVSEDSESAVVRDAAPTERRKSSSPTTSIRPTASLNVDRRRRLRELRRLRRHRHTAVTVDNHELHRDRRRFAMPRQPPPRFHDRQIADVELRANGSTADASSSMQLAVGYRRGRVLQPWSALNKLVVCQLVDVVLSQELTSPTTVWQSATVSGEKRRPSGVIWNPAITPETREFRNPTPPRLSQTVNDLSSLVSAERCTSTLLHSLLSPMAAAAAAASSYLRRSDVSAADVDINGGSLAWTLPQSSTGRRRHHSAAASDNFHAPWTSPSFFWYNVPPSQGNFFLMPDATSRPCYRWINAALPPTSDTSALDYRTQTLDTDGYPVAVDIQARVSAETVPAHIGLSRSLDSRPSTPPSSVSSQRVAGTRLKWVVVNKTDVSSLFESLASSMVTDVDENRTSSEPEHHPTTGSETSGVDKAPRVVSAASTEPIKWKSTLLRRARAEAQTPKRSGSDSDATENTRVLFHVDC